MNETLKKLEDVKGIFDKYRMENGDRVTLRRLICEIYDKQLEGRKRK